MGDKTGAGRLVTTVLLGLTVTTAAAIGLVWLFQNRRRSRNPSNSSDVYDQYSKEIVQSLESNKKTPVPINYNAQFNANKKSGGMDDGELGAGESISVTASTTSAEAVLQAAQQLLKPDLTHEDDDQDPEESNEGIDSEVRLGKVTMEEREEDKHVSVDCIIPKDSVAGIIGKRGSHIKQIQKDSNTRIHFNNETLDNGDRMCVIRGRADDVAFAEDLIRKYIASQPVTLTKEILVPQQSVGRIIGRHGDTIRGIQDLSKAKINVDSGRFETREGDEETTFNVVILKGTQDQIDVAESLILEKVEDERNFRKSIQSQASSRTMRRANPPLVPSPPPPKTPPTNTPPKQSHNLIPNGITQVYVSCVYHPNMFWIQQVGQDSIELDKLGESMTEFYQKQGHDDEDDGEFKVGDIVAATFQMDDKMYRGKVIDVLDVDTVEVEYVDYGDRRPVPRNQLRTLSPIFLGLKFQAIQASLNLTCPESKWSDVAITRFCDLSYCAQWKSLTGKVKGFQTNPQDNNKSVWLELMDEEVNIGEELVKDGLARPKDDYAPPTPTPSPSSSSNETNGT